MTAESQAPEALTSEALTPELFLEVADHTLLAPGTTRDECEAFLDAAAELGVKRVCISPTLIPADKRGLEIVTVVGFPTGVHHAAAKAFEAAQAVRDGADEVDMVVNPGLVQAADWAAVEAEIRAVREAIDAVTPNTVLKVIIESAGLSDEQIVGSCRASEAAGADFVKTSTGFSAAGGASAHAVQLMAATVGGRLGVKASGGIRTAAAVRELWAVGATRFGVSATGAIVDDWAADAAEESAGSGY